MNDTAVATDTCPRCGGGLRCGANDAAPCACTTLTLAASTLAALRERFDGCLCIACLAQLAAAPPAEALPTKPSPP